MPVDPSIEPELFAAAVDVRRHAHVPYSHFPVGAAVRTTTGEVFVGANVENAAYPEGMCAEASAIAAMASAGHRAIAVVVTVCGEVGDPEVGTCCGGCRQKIREFATVDTVIHNADPDGVRRSFTMDELLPGGFGPEHIERSSKT